MNPFAVFQAVRQMADCINELNRITLQSDGTRRWSLAYTNRSTIAMVLSMGALVLSLVGFPFPIPVDLAADHIYTLISAAGILYAGLERLRGKTRALWNPSQVQKAVQETDALAAAISDATGGKL